ncbi:DUF4178 domain-containing protein [Adhaeribacter soli]|uniref:DUF4178 domain-containing protein n=1 Tax=Adhaeribacter soli TaxID=2607655 RepID=A0A5N1J6S6_9BACT|nr:DUF4178 domain-containing protein [Adhaeribacter soli]KAA9345662.1 DUF4178 domain-containing protein [Adhaeribacter soli]
MIGAEVEVLEKLPETSSITCPKCSQELPCHTYAQARNIVCNKCDRIFEIREGGLLTVKQFEKYTLPPVLPLGAKGRLKGVPFTVVGFIVYQERDSHYRWREYVLFNPVQGYAYLSEFNGHWNFFQPIYDYSHGNNLHRSFVYEGATFNLFHRYYSKVVYASGEFFWNITSGSPFCTEYVAPPYIITRIKTEKQLTWLLGEYLEPELIKEAFGLQAEMPQQIGIGATEPLSGGLSFGKIKKISVIAALALLFLHLFFMIIARKEVISNTEFTFATAAAPPVQPGPETDPVTQSYLLSVNTSSAEQPPIVGPAFKLSTGLLGSSNMLVSLSAPVQNDWFATAITLRNTTTMQEYDFELGVEYYSGYEDGYSWSEGNHSTETLLSALPDGEYQTFIRPYQSQQNVPFFTLKLENDVPVWSNFWIILLLITAFPAIQYFREKNFEMRRWMNSDFSPYDQ